LRIPAAHPIAVLGAEAAGRQIHALEGGRRHDAEGVVVVLEVIGFVELLAVEQDPGLVAAAAAHVEVGAHVVAADAGQQGQGAEEIAAELGQGEDVVAAERQRGDRLLAQERDPAGRDHHLLLGDRSRIEDHLDLRGCAGRHRDPLDPLDHEAAAPDFDTVAARSGRRQPEAAVRAGGDLVVGCEEAEPDAGDR
jgi:hypothetical protein